MGLSAVWVCLCMHFKVGRTTFYMCQLWSWKCLPYSKTFSKHSPILAWCRGTKIELNWIIRTIPRKHQTSHINTDNLRCWLFYAYSRQCVESNQQLRGSHSCVKGNNGSFIWRKGKCNLWLFNVLKLQWSVDLLHQRPTQPLLLNKSDVNKKSTTIRCVTTSLKGLVNKAPGIPISSLIHSCCFYGSVLQINQSGHQVQILTKINVPNNALCIGRSVGLCRSICTTKPLLDYMHANTDQLRSPALNSKF